MTTWNQFVEAATKMANQTGFPLSVLLGQAAVETGRGTSHQSQNKNNWFGLGAYDANPNMAFGFKSAEDSIKYYINLIKNDPLYSKAWAAKDNPNKMVQEIKAAGYASDPQYVQKVTGTQEFNQNVKATQKTQAATRDNYTNPSPSQLRPSQQYQLQQSGLISPLPQGHIWKDATPKKTSLMDNLVPQAYAETSQPPSLNQYTVKSGDTLWGIAQNTLGNGANWKQLGYQGNPSTLPIGTKLNLPQKSTQNYSPAPKSTGLTNYAGQPASVPQVKTQPTNVNLNSPGLKINFTPGASLNNYSNFA